MKVFMQLDVVNSEYNSFIWAEDMNLLKNILVSFQGDTYSFGDDACKKDHCYSYRTNDLESLKSILSMTFDEVTVVENEIINSTDFIAECKEYLNETN